MEAPDPVARWAIVDIQALHDWPPYTPLDADRYASVNWPAACEIAIDLVEVDAPISPIDIPEDLPENVHYGLELLLIKPIDATPEQLTDGGHRLLAMKNQGVRYTVGIAYTDS